MPKKSRKFIDRKNAITFHLVHRSQQDPLIADENAPQRVLLPEKSKNEKKRLDEQQKFGIFFDDDYNYLQHLRDTSNTMEWERVEAAPKTNAKLILPSSVFASKVEEDVGLLNKAAPHTGLRLDLDPDVVAAMDEDFDYSDPENELEDNFVELANADITEEEYASDEEEDVSSDFLSEEEDEVASLEGLQYSFKDEETKSRFTEYSMTSSVIRRNVQLTLLDDRFEKMYAGYDENEIGPLDCEEIEGHVPENSDLLLQCAEEFEKQKKREHLGKSKIIMSAELQESDGEREEFVSMELPQKEKWDCESILSTYSNLYNHPKLISEPSKQKIKINMRTGMPMNILDSNKLTAKALSTLNELNDPCNGKGARPVGVQSVISNLSTLSIRPKDETPEQRKERKKLLKGYRRERRLEKKVNAQAFKEEAKRQMKITLNNRNNVQGNKIL